jgi:hypothetical protein
VYAAKHTYIHIFTFKASFIHNHVCVSQCKVCPAGFFTEQPCDGQGYSDTVNCIPCTSSCPAGNFLSGCVPMAESMHVCVCVCVCIIIYIHTYINMWYADVHVCSKFIFGNQGSEYQALSSWLQPCTSTYIAWTQTHITHLYTYRHILNTSTALARERRLRIQFHALLVSHVALTISTSAELAQASSYVCTHIAYMYASCCVCILVTACARYWLKTFTQVCLC